MISYERIDFSEGIDLDRGKNSRNLHSVKCMLCNYFYLKDIDFKYQPYVCNACHDFPIGVQNLSDFCVATIKNVDYRVYIIGVDKKSCYFYFKKLRFR